MQKIKLFTHTDLDGIGCAILAYLAVGQGNVDVEFCDYKNVDEKVREFYLHNDVDYDHIFITDISINEENAQEIDTWVARDYITLLDHHATALWLNDYSWANVRIKDKCSTLTSGTMMFYRYLMDEGVFDKYDEKGVRENIDQFAYVVRDYDTWRWKETESGIICKYVNDLLYMYGREKFIEWALEGIEDEDILFPYFSLIDETLLEQKQKDIDTYIESKNKQLNTLEDNFGYMCGIVFAERYFSELGNRLSELHPELDYIAMIDICRGQVSYRTVRDDIDLGGEIAHSLGGGGHRKAAGSTFEGKDMQWIVIGNVFNLERAIV